MYLLHGNLYMKSGDYNRAIQSFGDAQAKLGSRKERPPLIISLVSVLLPRNALQLIPVSYRFRGGSLMILQLRFTSDHARPFFQRATPRRLASLSCAWWAERSVCPSQSRRGFLVSHSSICPPDTHLKFRYKFHTSMSFCAGKQWRRGDY